MKWDELLNDDEQKKRAESKLWDRRYEKMAFVSGCSWVDVDSPNMAIIGFHPSP